MPSELLKIEPGELQFPFEPRKQVSCSIRLINLTTENVAFKVRTTSPKKYCVRPNKGVVSPSSSIDVTVMMQAQRAAPEDLQCKDKFLILSVMVPSFLLENDISADLFCKEAGRNVSETKLRASYVRPLHAPLVLVSDEDKISSRSFDTSNNSEERKAVCDMQSTFAKSDLGNKLSELKASITTLNEERNAALRKCQILQAQLAEVLISKKRTETVYLQNNILVLCIVVIISFIAGMLVH